MKLYHSRKGVKNVIKNKKKGFTLVELLAVIVILAIILVIAVPKVMDVIKDSKRATLESTAKMIASSAEKAKVQNTILGNTDKIECKTVAQLNDIDYADCKVDFEGNTAKVSIIGKGKFAGLYVCDGTKTSATATDEECSGLTGNVEEFSTDSWETIVAAVKQAYNNGTEYPYNVGDEKTIDLGSLGEHTIRIANKKKCSTLDAEGKTVVSKTACGFVLEFVDIITTHAIRSGHTNAGGWPASEMRAYLNDLDEDDTTDGVIYNALPDALKDEIIDTYVISSHGKNDQGTVGDNKNYESTDKLYLLSPQEVWGSSFTNSYDTSNGTSRQLDYYEGKSVTTSSYEYAMKKSLSSNVWWLRSAASDYGSSSYKVNGNGSWSVIGSGSTYGVSPAFRLGE